MISPSRLCDIKDRIHTNEEKINLLNNINVVLKERHEIETNYNHLHIKINQTQADEAERKEKCDQSRKHYLNDLERHGQELCKEHAHILHQIEHITWHLEGCTRHRPCMGQNVDGCSKKSAPLSSCVSTSSAPTCNRPSAVANLKNSSERLIKSIVDLRKKIYIVQEKLEHEVKRKREMEKKLTELRKDISRQKKSLSVRRSTHNHTPLASSTIATSLTQCPSITSGQSQMGQSCSSLPPIKKPLLAK